MGVMVNAPRPPPCASPAMPRGLPPRRIPFRTCIRSSPPPVAAAGAPLSLGNFDSHLVGARRRRVFFLDVNPLCYDGAQYSLRSLSRWLELFFSDVSLRDPVVAVLDGEEGNEYRRRLMPSYKAHRRRFTRHASAPRSCEPLVVDLLRKCNVPVIKVHGYEADDLVATLTDQVLQLGSKVVIGSPDKDFKQLISEDVQMVMPLPELGRWSFYTLKHYIAQYKNDPSSDLSLRCFMGDEVDGVPGIQHFIPGFGRKTAIKLLKKHGSLENLLNAAAIRTVGKNYAQEALTKYADYLRNNYKVLSLRRDANIQFKEEWLSQRNNCKDSVVLRDFTEKLKDNLKPESRMMRKSFERSSWNRNPELISVATS